MIRAVYNLGRLEELENGNGYDYENPNEKNYYNNIIKIKYDVIDGEVKYKGLEIEEFSNTKLDKYLYSNGSSRGGDNTPTTIVSNQNEPLKKLMLPIAKIKLKEFENICEYLNNSKKYNELEEEIKAVFQDKEGYIITLFVNGKWIGEYQEIANPLIENNDESAYYMKSIGRSIAEEKICYCCNEKKDKVYGYAGLFPFYTVDNSGFVAGGFDQNKAWKNYPICPECYRILNKGKKKLKDGFMGLGLGMKYIIIPKWILPLKEEEEIENYKDVLSELKDKMQLSLGDERRRSLLEQDETIFDVMAEMENNLLYNIMFYDDPSSAFRILLNIEDIFPSRLKKIFDIKKEIENRKVYKNIKIYKGKVQIGNGLTFTFRTLKEFNSQKDFLNIINSIFIDKKIDYKHVIGSFIEVIIPKLNNNESCYYNIRNSFISLEVINKLELFNKRIKGEVKKVVEKTEKNKIYLDFFEEHSENFDTDLRRGIFLQGIMVQKLLNLPEQQGSKAFHSRLNGLKMNEKIIKRVYSEIIDKLIQYKKRHYYLEIEKLIGNYFASANFKGMSRDEMSYYFVLGMNLVGEFKNIEEEK